MFTHFGLHGRSTSCIFKIHPTRRPASLYITHRTLIIHSHHHRTHPSHHTTYFRLHLQSRIALRRQSLSRREAGLRLPVVPFHHIVHCQKCSSMYTYPLAFSVHDRLVFFVFHRPLSLIYLSHFLFSLSLSYGLPSLVYGPMYVRISSVSIF